MHGPEPNRGNQDEVVLTCPSACAQLSMFWKSNNFGKTRSPPRIFPARRNEWMSGRRFYSEQQEFYLSRNVGRHVYGARRIPGSGSFSGSGSGSGLDGKPEHRHDGIYKPVLPSHGHAPVGGAVPIARVCHVQTASGPLDGGALDDVFVGLLEGSQAFQHQFHNPVVPLLLSVRVPILLSQDFLDGLVDDDVDLVGDELELLGGALDLQEDRQTIIRGKAMEDVRLCLRRVASSSAHVVPSIIAHYFLILIKVKADVDQHFIYYLLISAQTTITHRLHFLSEATHSLFFPP